MTSPIALCATFVNLAVVLGLAAAIVSPRLSKLARLLTATFVFVCAWLANAAIDATRPPDWAVIMGGTVVLVSIVVVLASLQLWTQSGDSPPEHHGDQGGGGPRRRWPDAPQPGGGGSDPNWWPEFERQLALYVAEQDTLGLPAAGLERP